MKPTQSHRFFTLTSFITLPPFFIDKVTLSICLLNHFVFIPKLYIHIPFILKYNDHFHFLYHLVISERHCIIFGQNCDLTLFVCHNYRVHYPTPNLAHSPKIYTYLSLFTGLSDHSYKILLLESQYDPKLHPTTVQ